MHTECPQAPSNKKKYISDIGKILINNYGKKKYYQPKEVKEAHRKSKWYDGFDFSCWAMSTFSSHSDFDKHHEETGEICDYVEMKKEMLSELSVNPTPNLTEVVDLNIDISWLDFGDIFENIFVGIGEFIGGILE